MEGTPESRSGRQTCRQGRAPHPRSRGVCSSGSEKLRTGLAHPEQLRQPVQTPLDGHRARATPVAARKVHKTRSRKALAEAPSPKIPTKRQPTPQNTLSSQNPPPPGEPRFPPHEEGTAPPSEQLKGCERSPPSCSTPRISAPPGGSPQPGKPKGPG